MSRSLKVALVTGKYPPEYSGAGLRSHRGYLRLLARRPELELQVLCSGLEQRKREEYEVDGVPVQRIRPLVDPRSGRVQQALAGWGEALQTFHWLGGRKVDVIHVVGACAVTAAAITWARLRRVPLLIELVNAGASPAQSLPLLHHFWRPDLRRGTAIIAISEPLAEACRGLGLGDVVWQRPNPVDTGRFHPAPERRMALRHRLTPFGEADKVLVSVGKFMPLKNQVFLLDLLRELPTSYKLVLAGPVVQEGPWAGRDLDYLLGLKSRIRELGLEQRVHLVTGFVKAEEYIRLADIYLLPSLSEGLGTPMLESLACAVPVIANEGVPALRQWIRNGENGWLCPLEAEAWASAVRRVGQIPPSRLLEASHRVRQVAGVEVIDRGFMALLDALASSPADQPFPVVRILERAA